MISFLCIHWGRETFLKQWFSFPVETRIPDGSRVILSGQVCRREQASDYQVLYLQHNSVTYQGQVVQEPLMIIYDDSGQEICLGNTVEVTGELSHFEEERNPGGFSSREYYHTRKIAASVWSERLRCTGGDIFLLREFLSRLKFCWEDMLIEAAGEKEGGILCAMLLGDTGRMEEETRELYQINGIAHILAISGVQTLFLAYRWF